MTGSPARLLICVDFGSTFTKAALVDAEAGRLLATTQHPTTATTDILDGFEACRDALLAEHPAAADAEVLACSVGTVASRLNRAHKVLERRLSHLKGISYV